MSKDIVPSGLVVLRTPLLPMEEIDAWRAGLQVPHAAEDALDEALAHDRALLRERLRKIVARPEIAEALFLGSPDLFETLEQWRRDPESKKGKKTEQALVRYFLRMASRPTPFGLFSGCTAGRTGDRTRLVLGERSAYRRYSRLDMDYLFALCEHLSRDPEIRAELRFRPNSSLYETAGRLRFAESRVQGRMRTVHLVAIDAFDALRDTLRRAAGGARLHDLATALVESDPDGEITPEDAEAFLQELVDSQLLVPELALPVTGEESTAGLVEQLDVRQLDSVRLASDARTRLAETNRALRDIDAAGLGSPPDVYRRLASELEPLGVPVSLSRLFQVDLTKPPQEVVIGASVIDEVVRGLEVLQRFSRTQAERSLEEFRAAFVDRYGADREVPLVDVLDEESGIGFERANRAGAEASPLLSALPLQRRGESAGYIWKNEDAALMDLVMRAAAEGRTEIEIGDGDLPSLEKSTRPPMPEAFHAMAVLCAESAEAVERGEFRVLLYGGQGPSGARMLGRFCHSDPAIDEGVRKHLADEERLHPDAVFAEIVHLPAGRIGNVLARPVLRGHEIAFLGRSGAPPDRQIAVQDLMVTVSGDRIRLRSRSLDREIIPRITSAHNTSSESLGVYRFLAALQPPVGMQWDWGAMDLAPYLPRVVYGRLVLARARWCVTAAEIRPIAEAAGAQRYRLAKRLRETRRMPRYVSLAEGDNELFIDFENALTLDSVIELVHSRRDVTFTEFFPSPDELCAEGPEGRFFHELVIPFTRRPAETPVPLESRTAPSLLVRRTFPPGSEWLYAKLYTGTATADRVLCEDVAPLAREAVASGAARRWFFIRYAEGGWHLRIRFQGDPRVLRERVQPELESMAQRLIDTGAAWKLQFDTYEREVERYGGAEAIELAEEIFHCDSEAVVELLSSCTGDAGADLRWRFMLAGIDRLYADFGLDLAARLRLAERSRDAFGRQFHFDSLRDDLANRFRGQRASLLQLLDAPIPALDQRSAAIAPVARELLTRRLHIPIDAILPSLAHMFVNRLARSAGPEHELVLYDYAVQLYRSCIAREGKREGGRRAVG
ncbi:MAG TPA: lantibiotic dehydratase [Thermoanaerobaculia bacterium]|nr:lantibiotic dehydratase [Thermoanaerobaculia bacterium]